MRARTGISGASPSDPVRQSSGVMARSLAAQAMPFQQHGTRVSVRQPTRIELEGSPHPIVLRYRTQRLLLARIHQLQVCVTVTGETGPSEPCTMELSHRGKENGPNWTCRGGGTAVNGPTGVAIEALARTVDLVSCTADWSPATGQWHFCIEPYAGSHLRVYFPPITYTTSLDPREAGVISGALAELSTMLPGRKDKRTTHLESAGGTV